MGRMSHLSSRKIEVGGFRCRGQEEGKKGEMPEEEKEEEIKRIRDPLRSRKK